MDVLPLIWIGIIAFGIIMYVILDGFDLGIGILSIFFDENDRDLMVSAILPVWDGNETWLVFGGAALYGAFPTAFSIILPAVYIPLLMMVLALLFRGAAFEFRLKAIKSKSFWDICFFSGSLVATIAQGLILGTFVNGFQLDYDYSALVFHQWFNLFGIGCAIALIFGYVLLGSNRLIAKTTGHLQKECFKISRTIQYLILLAVIMVSVWSPFLAYQIKERWFNPQYMAYLAILPFITVIAIGVHWYALRKRYEYVPFWASIVIFLMCYIGFIISCYPYIVPRYITYIQAAANRTSLLFMLIGACVMMPPLLFYTYYSYRIFKGKVTEKIGYH